MNSIKLSLKQQVRVVDEYWAEAKPDYYDVSAEIIYKWVEAKYNCSIAHFGSANAFDKIAYFRNA